LWGAGPGKFLNEMLGTIGLGGGRILHSKIVK